ncbi:MAG TPA: formylglycine-generating enzyme family protein, partial [Nevskiaceae bacterium]|nr:formylglycine-generating enzyme family protein [Nevskiaceae bacterium]
RNASAADCPVCPELVSVPGGRYDMGDQIGDGEADERPVHSVTIAPMRVGRYEVTFDEWDACVAAGGCSRRANDSGWGRGRRPVINVNWSDAQQYLRWLSSKTGHAYRLPTEAELEYLNRAGGRSRYPWGDDPTAACTRANVSDRAAQAKHPDWTTFPCNDGFEETSPVGSFPGNAFGLYDVAGNVWEWTEDCYQPGYRDAAADGSARTTGDCRRRIIRGGSWGDAPINLRSSDRTGGDPGRTYNIVGFRVVRAP